jgi:hypothetical protein
VYVEYFYWQFVVAPVWLSQLIWNLQRALVQFFSVPLLLRTLFSHWHKDRVSLQQGSISGILQAVAWNLISRVIGFCVRVVVLAGWLITQIVFAAIATLAFLLFLAWPLLIVVALALGVALLVTT